MRCLAIGFLLAVGCGGSNVPGSGPDGEPAAACALPRGLYMSHWEVMSGSCPAAADAVVNFDSVPAPWAGAMPDNCAGSVAPSEGGCSIAFDVMCSGPGSVYLNRGSAKWTPDLSRGQATVFQSSASSLTGKACSGAFAATWTKL